jgi:alkylation response protein AidB-like acyl-CoA dehydrogenase
VNLDLTPEHELVRSTVREFAEQKVAPVAAELDREHRFPYELVAELAELGLMGMPIPEDYGGAGTDTLSYAIAVEELTRIDSSFAITVAAHTSLGMMPILLFGTEEQKQRWLVPGIAGEKIGALGITEPGAGSDVAGITTTAVRTGDSYIVNGAKTFITNGVRADFLVCACKTTQEGGHGGISFLVLEREMPGYEVAAKLEKMGWHSSDTGELAFTDVEVPAENLLVTQRAVLEIADTSLQIHGGYGYMREYGIERAVRDARLGPIGGGTDEIMKEILGKTMGL